VFLNHGSYGACPRAILALQAELRRQMEAEPVQFLWRRYEERLEPARAALANFLGARARDVVFVTNATTGVNAVVRSLRLRPGDELLTTSHDYNACRNALAEVARRAGAKVTIARIPFPIRSGDEAVEAVLRAATRRTRLAMVDHVTSHTALVLPIARIVRELEARGIDTLVDGAHAPGMLPLDLARLRPAAYTGNLHKWVCAPKGAAFLWVREDRQADVQPAVVSHGNNTPRPGYTAFQDRFDWAGTSDPTAWFCVGEAIRWMARQLPGGWREVRRRNHELAVRARQILSERLGVEPPCPENMLGSMATLPLPARMQGRPKRGKIDDEQLRLYDEFGIEVPLLRIGQPETRYFRVSAQLYNSQADYEYLAEAMRKAGVVRSIE
jgi:isopenicillin-N epimerase